MTRDAEIRNRQTHENRHARRLVFVRIILHFPSSLFIIGLTAIVLIFLLQVATRDTPKALTSKRTKEYTQVIFHVVFTDRPVAIRCAAKQAWGVCSRYTSLTCVVRCETTENETHLRDVIAVGIGRHSVQRTHLPRVV